MMAEPITRPADTLRGRTTRAAQWRLAGTLIGAVFQFGIGVLLARLLSPAEFGLMAVAFVVLGLAQPLGDLGIGNAVVQRAQLTPHHVRAAFTFSVLFGLAITAAILAVAPLAARIMRDPNVAPVLYALAWGFAIRGTAVVAAALMRRDLDFKRQFFIDSGSYVFGYGVVSVTLALLGYGVWSLVAGALAQSILGSAAQLAVMRHPWKPLLAKDPLRDLLGFGLGASLNGGINYVALNGDNFVVGRWIGASGLGLYSRAYTLMNLPFTYASHVMSTVLFPAMSQVQGEPLRLRRAYLLLTQLTAAVAAPAMATMVVVAPHLVPSLYGRRWAGVVTPLQILAAAGYFRALYHLDGVAIQSVGRVYAEVPRQVVYAVLVIGCSLVGTRFGLAGVAVGVDVAIIYMFVALGQLALSATETTWMTYLRVQLPSIGLALMTGAVALSMRLLLERYDASGGIIAIAVLAGAGGVWGIGMLRMLGRSEFDSLRSELPALCARLVERVRSRRTAPSPYAGPVDR